MRTWLQQVYSASGVLMQSVSTMSLQFSSGWSRNSRTTSQGWWKHIGIMVCFACSTCLLNSVQCAFLQCLLIFYGMNSFTDKREFWISTASPLSHSVWLEEFRKKMLFPQLCKTRHLFYRKQRKRHDLLLIEAGADVNSTESDGKNCMKRLINEYSRTAIDLPILKFYLNFGAN